jgi:hypothetical protein
LLLALLALLAEPIGGKRLRKAYQLEECRNVLAFVSCGVRVEELPYNFTIGRYFECTPCV